MRAISLWACLAALLPTACRHADTSASLASATAPSIEPAFRCDTVAGKVKVGENFLSIVRGLGLDERESSLLLAGIKDNFRFKLLAGQVYRVVLHRDDPAGKLAAFAMEDRFSETKHALYRNASVTPAVLEYRHEEIPVKTDTEIVSGVLSSNLYEAFRALGETPALIQQITKIFAWDIDFFKDPRVGDAFSLLVEKHFGEDGTFRGYGQVLSAKYVNRGHEFYGILYKGQYYDQDGRSLEKMLLKVPLPFAHVSSPFTNARLHPILGVNRPHWGIDYVAPKGTRIFAAGDGTVEYAKWVNGFGNTVKIRHNGVYNTYYAHLMGFASGMHAGTRVRQRDVIGFLGMTGLATGPHLDYRVEYNHKFINPATLKMESKEGIAVAEWKAFSEYRDHVLVRLAAPDANRFAGPVPAAVPHTPG